MSNSSVVDSAMVCIRRVLSGLLFVLAISISNVAMAEYELIFYAGNGDLKMVKVLLDKGADVNKMTYPTAFLNKVIYTTALIEASQQGHKEIVRLLLDRGADVNIRTNNGATALIWASLGGHKEVVQLLLNKGADVNVAQIYNGETALIKASLNGHKDVVRLLLNKGADVNVRTANNGVPAYNGATALFIASEQGHKDVVRLLLDKGADVNVRANTGATALFIASQKGYKEIVQLLLDKGADTNVKDNTGATALFIASQKGYKEIVQLLHQHSAASADNDGFVTQGGLAWMPINFSTLNWSEANAYCTNTAMNNQTGWRLPTNNELKSLYDSGGMNDHGWKLDMTWTSTPYAGGSHYFVMLDVGGDGVSSDTFSYLHVTCVH